MSLLERYLSSERREIMDNGVRLQAIGQLERLPVFVRMPLKALCHESRNNKGMVLSLALSYGSRAEIVDAAKALARQVKAGRLDPERIDEALFSNHLYTAGLPDPDLLIRTSGELRPDFRRPQLDEALAAFGSRERRFGFTGAQLASARQPS